MFDNLRDAFREAVSNFKDELGRDEVPEAVDSLLKGMQIEVTDSQTHVKSLEAQIKRALQLAEMEKKEAATCRRREEMAMEIKDEETARVARQFAEKHEQKQSIQEQKALALKKELDVRRAEVAEMLEKLKEAQKQRDALAATAGRASARNSLSEADDLFSELDRIAEKMSDGQHRQEAYQDLLEEFGAEDIRPEEPPVADVDRRLEELKRKMGKE
jgi:hypothetical protein